jgi:hypothetical protein
MAFSVLYVFAPFRATVISFFFASELKSFLSVLCRGDSGNREVLRVVSSAGGSVFCLERAFSAPCAFSMMEVENGLHDGMILLTAFHFAGCGSLLLGVL